MDREARRLLAAFSGSLNRPDPVPLDWQRLYEFILHAFRHSPQSSEAVGHALVQDGLDWDEVEPFVLFYGRAMELLEREAATRTSPRGTRKQATGRRSGPGRRPRARNRRRG
jgi:hypothetical protein